MNSLGLFVRRVAVFAEDAAHLVHCAGNYPVYRSVQVIFAARLGIVALTAWKNFTPVDSLSAAMLGGAQGRRCVGVGLDATRESANLVEDGFRRTPEVQRGDLDRLARVLDLVRTWLVLAGGVD